LGVVSLRDLILAPRHTILHDLMNTESVAVRAGDDRETVAQEIARYDLLAIPVLDDEGRLVGIVTHDDVMDVVVEEATEDVYRMGAVGPMAENYLEANFATVWRKRAFWLACLFGAELFTFNALSHFEEAIAELVVLSLFVPLCISTGGNSGSQAATLITRAMALGQVSMYDWWRVLRHELLMGLALGLSLGAIGFFRGALTPENVRGNIITRKEPFEVKARKETVQEVDGGERTFFPKDAVQSSTFDKRMPIIVPPGEKADVHDAEPGSMLYSFPEN